MQKPFTRFVRENIRSTGYAAAFDRAFWTTRQVEARLFRLGELEYELTEQDGERVISIHAPSDAWLEPDRLNASVDTARDFLRTYFPDWASCDMVCHSWLLSPDLAPYLPDTSRILRWQAAYDLQPDGDGKEAVLTWVFGLTAKQQEEGVQLQNLPENTALQRRLKALLLQGGSIREGRGRLARPFA